jgi:hypothetical protein
LTWYNEKGFVPVKVFPIGIPAVDVELTRFERGSEQKEAFIAFRNDVER